MPQADQPILIKKYANRRLYDGTAGRHVSLEDLATLLRDGDDFEVHDAKTGEDITGSVLKQIIVERPTHG